MARKFIIHEDLFIMGNVKYHFELVPDQNRTRPEGGGFWHIDREAKIFYLYGVSSDFGGLTQDRVTEIVSTSLLSPHLDGFKVLHCYALEFSSAKPEDWTEIHTIDLMAFAGTPDSISKKGNMQDYKLTAGGRALMNDMSPKKTVPVRTEPKIGRNEPCPCGSGKKYKKCCI
jgi:SEC-C motif